MARSRQGALSRLAGRLVVSVQADPGSPLRAVPHIVALARCAIAGGAAGLRLEGLENLAAVRAVTALPLIGLVKQPQRESDVYITPTAALARGLAAAGADIVAVDATLRPRPEPFAAIAAAAHEAGAEVLADISTLEEARAALAAGADAGATTLSGYVGAARGPAAQGPEAQGPAAQGPEAPDLELMAALAAAGIPFGAEGQVRTPALAQACLAAGAGFVVVGSAITRPDVVAGWFAAALAEAAARGGARIHA
ncbi:MAG: putative N-acetylmannosamine-6-phosphate 2-epimerase [Dongiaceae bacterium]